jgi:protein TonB
MSATALMPGARPPRRLLGLPMVISFAVHALLLALFYFARPGPAPPSPPIYRVDLVAAPPGERAAGVVRPQPEPAPTPTTQPPPVRPKTAPRDMPAPTKAAPTVKTPQATPTLPTETKTETKAPTPTAGGGETGGRGTDVATVSTCGIEFPYPGYLENIVRQIAIRFNPPTRGALRAEVAFLIKRDGTVSSITLVTRSGVYSFDVEAQGAVESAANARAFGALPAGYPDDVLPVTFRFDPKLLR